MDLNATSGGGSSIEEAQPLDSLAGGVFVGRQREMGELKATLEDALSGRGWLENVTVPLSECGYPCSKPFGTGI